MDGGDITERASWLLRRDLQPLLGACSQHHHPGCRRRPDAGANCDTQHCVSSRHRDPDRGPRDPSTHAIAGSDPKPGGASAEPGGAGAEPGGDAVAAVCGSVHGQRARRAADVRGTGGAWQVQRVVDDCRELVPANVWAMLIVVVIIV